MPGLLKSLRQFVSQESGTPDPVAIFGLSLLPFSAIGYVLIDQRKKAAVAALLWIILLAPPSCGTASGLISIAAAIDGYLQARLLQQGKSLGQWTFFNGHK
jgi:hypothetical protein